MRPRIQGETYPAPSLWSVIHGGRTGLNMKNNKALKGQME